MGSSDRKAVGPYPSRLGPSALNRHLRPLDFLVELEPTSSEAFCLEIESDAHPMQALIEALCSKACNGRAAGSPGGLLAKALLLDAFRAAGGQPYEQPVPGCQGTNLLVPFVAQGPRADRWVIVGAHYDHLGHHHGHTFFGADDNAAAVAMLVELAKSLATVPPQGRSVLLAAFDGEEPPFFRSENMGSEYFCRHPTVPLTHVDFMVCLDLVGHALGPSMLPPVVRNSFFVLGAERSEGTVARIEALAHSAPGAIARLVDAEVVPPMSDYFAFWQAKVPFAFLTCGRWQHYHQPTDTPDRLDMAKIAAIAKWLELLTRDTASRPDAIRFTDSVNDALTLRSLVELTSSMASLSPVFAQLLTQAQALLTTCDANGRSAQRPKVLALVAELEGALALNGG